MASIEGLVLKTDIDHNSMAIDTDLDNFSSNKRALHLVSSAPPDDYDTNETQPRNTMDNHRKEMILLQDNENTQRLNSYLPRILLTSESARDKTTAHERTVQDKTAQDRTSPLTNPNRNDR